MEFLFSLNPKQKRWRIRGCFDRLKNIPTTMPIGILGILTTSVVGTKTNRSEVRET